MYLKNVLARFKGWLGNSKRGPERISYTYQLVQFNHSADKGYLEALDIYAKSMHSSISTNTNDITYWIDRYNTPFEDKFEVFGFVFNGKMVGYCQTVYFCEKDGAPEFIMIDYIAIEKKYRANHIYASFIDFLREATQKNHPTVKHIVTEVDARNKALIRLLNIDGFKIVDIPYIQPMLGPGNNETEIDGIIMIYNMDEANNIQENCRLQSEEYRGILTKLYIDHYLRWYKPLTTDSEFAFYETHIHDLLNKSMEKITQGSYISLKNASGSEDDEMFFVKYS